jgi:hypothetical protein
VFHDTTAIAVVTSQAGQVFKPLTEGLQKLLGIGKGKLFENTARRIVYQDKISNRSEDPNPYSASAPGKGGTCSCYVVLLPTFPRRPQRRIALSLGPAPEE